jgi:subtilisin family serine protease
MEPLLELPETNVPGDLVVDLPSRDLVLRYLETRPGLRAATVAEDATLDLALLSLTDTGYLADRTGPPPVDLVDAVLGDVRAHFRGRADGWAPEMGKNRDVNGIVGFPQSRPHGFGEPETAPVEQWRRPGPPGAGRGVRVGVLDTAIFAHRDLAGHYLAETTYRPPVKAVGVWAGHATFIAGLIVAQAPAAELRMRAVLDNATGKATAWDTARKMAALAADGLDILNVSLGCRTADGEAPLVLRRAVEVLGRRALIVAAAGNHGQSDFARRPSFPAALPGVLAVGSAAASDLSLSATFSPRLPWVDCLAPGEDLVSTYLTNATVLTHDHGQQRETTFHGYARWSGTSFAAAQVTGAVARRMSEAGESAPEAVAHLLDTPNSFLQRYTWNDPGQ